MRGEERVGTAVARVGAGLVLVAGTLLVLRPFLVPMAWAAIVAYVTWPAFRAVRARTRRPSLAAAFFCVGTALGLGLPLAWLLSALASEATRLIDVARAWSDAGSPLPEWIARFPLLARRLEELRGQWLVDPTAVAQVATRYGAQVSSRLVDLAGGIAANVFKFAITFVTLFFFYRDGEQLTVQARRLAAVAFPAAPPEFLDEVGGVVRAVVFGLLGTALVQGILAGLGLAIFGVPSPVLLGALTFALSFVPAGPTLVWAGAALWLFLQGHHGSALGMTVWGLLLVSSIDNVLRPLLISGGPTRIPFLLVFFGVLGGLTAFGILGLFLGPVLLSVTFALLAEFPRRPAADTRA